MTQSLQTLPSDSIRAVLEDVFAAPAYDWDQEASPLAFLMELFGQLLNWLEGVRELHPALYWLILGVLTGILIAILVHVSVLIWLALKPRAHAVMLPHQPTAIRRDARWHMDEWRRLRAAGQFPEALAHRFTALILELERRKALAFDPAKTPREYSEEARLDEAGRLALHRLVASLYSHLFGGTPCTAEDLDRFDRDAGQLGGWLAA